MFRPGGPSFSGALAELRERPAGDWDGGQPLDTEPATVLLA